MAKAKSKAKSKSKKTRVPRPDVTPGASKRALVVGGVAVVSFILYHFMRGGSSSGRLTNAAVGGSITPYTPQAPVLVPNGESLYDPNTEALMNTPAEVVPNSNTAPGQTTTPSSPGYAVNIIAPKIVGRRKNAKRPTTRTHHGAIPKTAPRPAGPTHALPHPARTSKPHVGKVISK